MTRPEGESHTSVGGNRLAGSGVEHARRADECRHIEQREDVVDRCDRHRAIVGARDHHATGSPDVGGPVADLQEPERGTRTLKAEASRR